MLARPARATREAIERKATDPCDRGRHICNGDHQRIDVLCSARQRRRLRPEERPLHRWRPGSRRPVLPLAGNGGYDVGRYDITGTYDPASNVWSATTVITATATADLYRFDLDFDGMTLSSLVVNGKPAEWSREGAELVVVPQHKIRSGEAITIQATYSGVPKEFLLPVGDFTLRTGFMATDDGATVAGQPDVAAGWFPVSDHPRDKAAYDFHVTVPQGVGVVATGSSPARPPRAARPGSIGTHQNPWPATPRSTSENGTCGSGRRRPDCLSTTQSTQTCSATPCSGHRSTPPWRQGEIVDVLSAAFGTYPFSTVGAIVDDQNDLFFALETRTRPVYSKYFGPTAATAWLPASLPTSGTATTLPWSSGRTSG